MTETREDELQRLIDEQAADDRDYQAPEMARFPGAAGSRNFLSLDALSAMGAEEIVAESRGAFGGLEMSAEEEYLAGLEDDGDDFETKVLARLTEEERELYLSVFGDGASLRELEEKTGRSKSSIQRDVAALRVKLAALLEEEVGLDA